MDRLWTVAQPPVTLLPVNFFSSSGFPVGDDADACREHGDGQAGQCGPAENRSQVGLVTGLDAGRDDACSDERDDPGDHERAESRDYAAHPRAVPVPVNQDARQRADPCPDDGRLRVVPPLPVPVGDMVRGLRQVRQRALHRLERLERGSLRYPIRVRQVAQSLLLVHPLSGIDIAVRHPNVLS